MAEEHDIKLHEDVAELKADMKAIKENHLVHIYDKLKDIDYRLWFFIVSILGFLVAILVILLKRTQ